MNTTEQGDAYENKVFRLVKKLITDGTVAVGKHYSLHQKKAYPIDFGTDQFIADISIEVRNSHFNDAISNLIIFECKDLGRKLDKSDFEEWRGKTQNLPFGKKLYIVTSIGFPQPVIDKALNTGVGLIIWNGYGEEKWMAPRTLNEVEQRDYQFNILRGNLNAPSYPLIFENGCFYTMGEMLRYNGLPINAPTLKPSYLPRTEINKIVNKLLASPDFYSIETDKNEDKLLTFLNVKIEFQELPTTHNGKYDAIRHCIILPNWLISQPHRLRFSLAHELAHAYLHREKLRQYESFFATADSATYIPSEAEFHWFDVQANDFASYLLMPDAEFRQAVSILFKQHRLHQVPFVIDNQKGKFQIYYSIVDSIANHFDVSNDHVKNRLKKNGFVEIIQQPNRIGNILRGY